MMLLTILEGGSKRFFAIFSFQANKLSQNNNNYVD